MTLGEKLKNARLEAGLSQRQLCGGEITRNMLSQIENGAARPSMDTLRYFARRLEKPLSFFLDEEAVSSPNQALMDRARTAFDSGDHAAVLEALAEFREPDPIFHRERGLMQQLSLLALAASAAADGRELYALELLAKAQAAPCTYPIPELEKRRLLLLAQVSRRKAEVCGLLPSLDGELLLRAEGALEAEDLHRAAALLEAAQDRETAQWQFLRGQVYLAAGAYGEAAACLHRAEDAFPQKTPPLLEQCYRELGDYKQAYFYACKQK